MPLYLHACKSPQCSVVGVAIEHFFFRSDPPAPACEYCGGPTERRIGLPNVLWTRPLSSYNDPTKENAHEEGHWAWRTHTVSGNPEPVFITNFQEQREFCKSENLRLPGEVNPKRPHFGGWKEVGDLGSEGAMGRDAFYPFEAGREDAASQTGRLIRSSSALPARVRCQMWGRTIWMNRKKWYSVPR